VKLSRVENDKDWSFGCTVLSPCVLG